MIRLGNDVGILERQSGHALTLTLVESVPQIGEPHDMLSLAHLDEVGALRHHVIIHLREIGPLIHLLHRGRALIEHKTLEKQCGWD
jgi:hypothetical protein